MTDSSFLQFLLPKLLHTSLITSSLIIYSAKRSKYDQLFIYLGLLTGFVIDAILFLTKIDWMKMENLQIVLTSLISLFTIMIGFDMLIIKKNEKNPMMKMVRSVLLSLLPAIILMSQGIETKLYLMKQNKDMIMQQQPILIMLMVVISIATGFVYYYINKIYFSTQLKMCCNSSIIYFTGAIALSKLFPYLQQSSPNTNTSLVVLIRNQILLQPSNDYYEITGGYNLYWIMISLYLLYDINKKK